MLAIHPRCADTLLPILLPAILILAPVSIRSVNPGTLRGRRSTDSMPTCDQVSTLCLFGASTLMLLFLTQFLQFMLA